MFFMLRPVQRNMKGWKVCPTVRGDKLFKYVLLLCSSFARADHTLKKQQTLLLRKLRLILWSWSFTVYSYAHMRVFIAVRFNAERFPYGFTSLVAPINHCYLHYWYNYFKSLCNWKSFFTVQETERGFWLVAFLFLSVYARLIIKSSTSYMEISNFLSRLCNCSAWILNLLEWKAKEFKISISKFMKNKNEFFLFPNESLSSLASWNHQNSEDVRP